MIRTDRRWTRARDYAVTALGGAFVALAAIFVAGRIWFRGLFAAAVTGEPLVWAGCFLAVAAALGILHAFGDTPLSGDERRAYNDRA